MDELAGEFMLSNRQRQLSTNDGEENLWWNWIRQVRRMLVKRKEIDGSVYGVWRITERGLRRIGERAK